MPRPAKSSSAVIEIRGARQNNLKNLDLDIPIGQLSVVTGPSGSGKSSLAFDTLYAEGQRRYVETFSPYTRQFLDRMDKPQVDEIRGIPPAIAIEQSNFVKTTRSTVGTITEINDYLKLLLPRVVEAVCPTCARQIRTETAGSILSDIRETASGRTLLITFAVAVPENTKPSDFFDFLGSQGFLRVLIYGKILRTDEVPELAALPALVSVIQDRITISPENQSRLSEAIESALGFGKDRIQFVDPETNEAFPFSTGWHCAHCDLDIRPPTPALFTFNNPQGACATCRGFGRVIGIDTHRALPNQSLTIRTGVVKPFQTSHFAECQTELEKHAKRAGISLTTPFRELPEEDRKFVLDGDPNASSPSDAWENGMWYGVRGFFDWLESRTYKMHVRVLLSRYRSYTQCLKCGGGRFQPDTLNFRVPPGLTLPQLNAIAIRDLGEVFEKLTLPTGDDAARMLSGEIRNRIRYLNDVGLGYLTLDRSTRTLSGGEIERVNLTTCLGASLVNTLFVMDEPSVGLHPRDVSRLLHVMHDLRDKGNTLVVVEHEEAVIRAADNIVEIGPGRGDEGGELVHNGPLSTLLKNKASLTGEYLSFRKSIPVPKDRRKPTGWITVKGASANNLRKIDVQFPLGVLGCVSGVSGSGKSTLVHEVLHRNLINALGQPLEDEPGACAGIEGAEQITKVVMVDQSPLARSPRSTPAVYLGAFDTVREFFAMTDDARAQGLSASAFSFNSGVGRCERCSGLGFEKVEMQFLSDLFVRCADCDGKRYQSHVLRVRWKGLSIDDVLNLTVSAAIRLFEPEERAKNSLLPALSLLDEVGLGYLRLGQPLNTLSGGESQRLKLVSHLADTSKSGAGKTLMIFDEPSTGLHIDDVAMLLRAFQRIVAQGDSLLVIEHNLEILKCADFLIDLGPEAGDAGGYVVGAGTPEEIAQIKGSHTGAFLKDILLGKSSKLTRYSAEDTPSARVAETAPRFADCIGVYGAREHNLKDITVKIPREKMVVITGLSGSGKSTLAFDLLFAEGQRRFLDSMSPYARQFVEQMEKPDVDLIEGLPPTVAIEQRLSQGGGKSTVATVTEVYHFLRLLFAKIGTQYCPTCKVAVEKQSLGAIAKVAETAAMKGKIRVLAPLIKARKGFHNEVAKWAEKQGFDTLLVDGKLTAVAGFQRLERFKEHTIDVVVGEMNAKTLTKARNLIQRAVEIGRGSAKLLDAKNRVTILSAEMACPSCGEAFEDLDPRLFSFNSPHGWCPTCRGFGEVFDQLPDPAKSDDDNVSQAEREMREERHREWIDDAEAKPCPECAGARLNRVARAVRVRDLGIDEFVTLPVSDLSKKLDKLKFTARQQVIARDLVSEMHQRFAFLDKVGLGYLSLNRSARTLSGGESQRIRLAAQLGSNLRGVLYVLDEPTIGLHPRDNRQLIETLLALREKGNSLVVVEHDEDTMRNADHIIDLGPGAGSRGGEIVASGTLAQIKANPKSATGRYLKKPMSHPLKGERRSIDSAQKWLEITGASANNLKKVNVSFPVGKLTVLTGISGSGKSSLMRSVLLPSVKAAVAGTATESASWTKLKGAEVIETVYEVDQSPIGKTSRSTPATYIKVFDNIRELFAQLPVSRMRGYKPSRFSFNVQGGRCEACGGHGEIKLEMSFLPASYVPCDECGGKRYNAATREALYQDRSIADVMEMTIEEASDFFAAQPRIARPLKLLRDTGLGYLKLGQPSPTLSGGEAQRIKLVTELTRGAARGENAKLKGRVTGKSTLYLLEEPTIGLHMADVEQLIQVLHRLVDEGATVVVIEHNLDVICEADYLIDIGPEAGTLGGEVVATGTPEQVATHKISRIAPFLREVLPTVG